MARTLYRIYLYFVLTLLSIFAAVATAIFLSDLLQRTVGGAGTGILLRQPAALASVALVVTAIFGGLHYWLIRRDIAQNPRASQGAVRAFFLNVNEAIAALAAVISGAVGFSQIGSGNTGTAGAFGPVVAFGAFFGLLELERRRGPLVEQGGALALQRLHFYGVQLVFLFIGTAFWLNALGQTVNAFLLRIGYAPDPCVAERVGGGECYSATGQFLGNLWLAALWMALAWAGSGWLAQRDVKSSLRAVLHLAGLTYGIGFALFGVGRGIEVALRGVFGVQDVNPGEIDAGLAFDNAVAHFNFVAPLLFGLLVAGAYWLWLHRAARQGGVLSVATTRQTSLALAAALAALPFWFGWALTLGGIFERVVPQGAPPTAASWATNIAIIGAGAPYVPLALWLGALARRTGISTPRRGFVYALLALGTLTGTFSLIFVLFAVVSNVLNAPLANWQQSARQGFATVVVGALVVGIYSFIARREGWFTRQPAPAEAPPAMPSAETLESVLDELTARRLTRDEAAARIRALAARGL